MRGCAGVDGRAYSALETRRNGPAGRRANDDEYCAHVARLPFLATRVLRQCARARACVCACACACACVRACVSLLSGLPLCGLSVCCESFCFFVRHCGSSFGPVASGSAVVGVHLYPAYTTRFARGPPQNPSHQLYIHVHRVAIFFEARQNGWWTRHGVNSPFPAGCSVPKEP